jgi:hypothetical protein
LERVQRSPGKETNVEDGTVVGEASLEDEEDIVSVDLEQVDAGEGGMSPMTATKKPSGQTISNENFNTIDLFNEPLPELSIDLKDYQTPFPELSDLAMFFDSYK